jgi:hypothetical protein
MMYSIITDTARLSTFETGRHHARPVDCIPEYLKANIVTVTPLEG